MAGIHETIREVKRLYREVHALHEKALRRNDEEERFRGELQGLQNRCTQAFNNLNGQLERAGQSFRELRWHFFAVGFFAALTAMVFGNLIESIFDWVVGVIAGWWAG